MNPTQTIAAAQAYLHEHREEGADCPACGRLVKLYRRVMTSAMVTPLIELYDATARHVGRGGDLDDYLDFCKWKDGRHGSGDFAKLRHWGFIERPHEERGAWRITRAGRDFVNGSLTVPSHVLMFKGRCIGLDGDEITIEKALGTQFDYADLAVTRTRGAVLADPKPIGAAVAQESFI